MQMLLRYTRKAAAEARKSEMKEITQKLERIGTDARCRELKESLTTIRTASSEMIYCAINWTI